MGYTTSPLRYPGGKIRLSNFIKSVILKNHLENGDYIEPYAGGAGIAWRLLFDHFVDRVHINDLNRSVYAFWFSVFNHTDELCKLIDDAPISMEQWQIQKKIQSDQSASYLELGFSTFFLNRTNRSGIIGAGVIGGKEQSGEYKLDARFNKKDLKTRIQKIASFKSKVEIYNQDALFFIKNTLPAINNKALVYLDPPYYKKGAALYESHYIHADHEKIAFSLANVMKMWIVSYDHAPEICKMNQDYRHQVYRLSYSVADRYNGQEIMFFSPSLLTPDVSSPLDVKSSEIRKNTVIQSEMVL